MATLEKIRSRSVLLVSIIFVALFLFIITIIDNPIGLFVDQTTVVNVNGDKIDYEKYQARINEVREANPEATNVENTAIQALITESLMEQEFKKLGITVTADEISNLMAGENANPYIVNAFMQTFGTDPETVLAAINDPAANNLDQEQADMLRRHYVNFENNLVDQLSSQKLMNLITGTINANKLDARAIYDESHTTYTLATVSRSLFEKPDSVTPAEVEEFYKNHRERYNIRETFGIAEPKRYVRYVTLDIVPSGVDRQRAMQQANEAVAMLENSQNMDTLIGNSAFMVERKSQNSEQLKAANIAGLSEFLDSAAPGQVKIINPNSVYNGVTPRVVIARLIGRENRVNSGKLVQIAIDGTVSADSIAALLNAGVPVDSIKGVASVGTPQDVQFSELGEAADTLRAAGVGKYIAFGNVVAGIGSLNDPEMTYDYYTAIYNVEPSRETIDGLNTRMRDFLINAPTADKFITDNAMQQGLMVRDAIIGPSDPSIDNLDDSQGMIAWAMNADKGQVSRLYTNSKNTRLSALAVVDEYDEYVTTSFPALLDGLTAEAQQEKTANRIISEFAGKGKTLADYQKAMGVARIDTMRGVNFSAGRYGTLSSARGHKVGDVVGPLRWNTAVVVYSIVDANEGTMPFDEASASTQFRNSAQRSVIGQDLVGLLLGDGRIENRIINFTRQD